MQEPTIKIQEKEVLINCAKHGHAATIRFGLDDIGDITKYCFVCWSFLFEKLGLKNYAKNPNLKPYLKELRKIK